VPFVVALAGKGGTGKTTVAGLVVRSLRRAIITRDKDERIHL